MPGSYSENKYLLVFVQIRIKNFFFYYFFFIVIKENLINRAPLHRHMTEFTRSIPHTPTCAKGYTQTRKPFYRLDHNSRVKII